jgi:DNA replication protein DnaC
VKNITEIISRTTPITSSDSEIISKYMCPGCEENVVVKRMILLAGPKKGEQVDIQLGCKCEEIALVNQVLKEREEAQKKKILLTFNHNSLINDKLKHACFDNYEPRNDFQKHAKKTSLQFVDTFSKEEPHNLLFTGSYGIGKSHLAVAIIKRLMEKECSSVFISVPKLLTKLKATYNKKSEHTEDELLTALEQVDCLVLDDVGAEHGTKDHNQSWAVSKVFEVVDSRIGKHTIYTTNLNGIDLQGKVGARNFSRMMQDTEIVRVQGEDYRLRNFK